MKKILLTSLLLFLSNFALADTLKFAQGSDVHLQQPEITYEWRDLSHAKENFYKKRIEFVIEILQENGHVNEVEEKMWPLPISRLFMCGHSSQRILHTLGITTIGELARTDLSILTAHLKSHGQTLYEYANGIDSSIVITWHEEAKGVGHSTTLSKDVSDAGEAYEVLKDLSNQVSRRLKAGNHLAGSLCTEIKYATFQSVSHQTILSVPSADPQVIYKTACRLFDDLWDKTPIRLLGIRATRLTDRSAPVQMSIFDYDEQKSKEIEKQQKLDDVLENIRKKYGNEAITRGTKRNP